MLESQDKVRHHSLLAPGRGDHPLRDKLLTANSHHWGDHRRHQVLGNPTSGLLARFPTRKLNHLVAVPSRTVVDFLWSTR